MVGMVYSLIIGKAKMVQEGDMEMLAMKEGREGFGVDDGLDDVESENSASSGQEGCHGNVNSAADEWSEDAMALLFLLALAFVTVCLSVAGLMYILHREELGYALIAVSFALYGFMAPAYCLSQAQHNFRIRNWTMCLVIAANAVVYMIIIPIARGPSGIGNMYIFVSVWASLISGGTFLLYGFWYFLFRNVSAEAALPYNRFMVASMVIPCVSFTVYIGVILVALALAMVGIF
mmetsp:Transcript_2336/g.6503  ORF Transcript_2336/g.6503 Transcript_2336/m.6503 type:complete len:234 (+) Transcript_2336:175-876(+)